MHSTESSVDVKMKFHSLLIRHYVELSGHLQILAASDPGKELLVLIEQKVLWAPQPVLTIQRSKKVALSDHDSLVFSHVITLPVENLI
jgi:hypothetical protein